MRAILNSFILSDKEENYIFNYINHDLQEEEDDLNQDLGKHESLFFNLLNLNN